METRNVWLSLNPEKQMLKEGLVRKGSGDDLGIQQEGDALVQGWKMKAQLEQAEKKSKS